MPMTRGFSTTVLAGCVLALAATFAQAQEPVQPAAAAASGSITGELGERARETGGAIAKGAQEAASAVSKGARQVGGAMARTAGEIGAGAASAAQGAWKVGKEGAQTVGAAASAAVKAAKREVQARRAEGAASSVSN